jgi:hypothetical protein
LIGVIAGRSLKKPARIRVEGETLSRNIGFDYRGLIRRTCGTAEAEGMLDYVAYCGPVYTVMVTLDNTKHGVLLHASLSRQDADPTWAEIKSMKAVVFGDLDVMIVLPKQALYVNVHEHCFHLWQMPVDWGIQ